MELGAGLICRLERILNITQRACQTYLFGFWGCLTCTKVVVSKIETKRSIFEKGDGDRRAVHLGLVLLVLRRIDERTQECD